MTDSNRPRGLMIDLAEMPPPMRLLIWTLIVVCGYSSLWTLRDPASDWSWFIGCLGLLMFAHAVTMMALSSALRRRRERPPFLRITTCRRCGNSWGQMIRPGLWEEGDPFPYQDPPQSPDGPVNRG